MPRKKIIPKNTNLPTEADVMSVESLSPMLDAAIKELQEFAKKKPSESLNLTKIKILNRLLVPIKNAIQVAGMTMYLDLLDEESIPSYSDAVLILSQYRAAIHHFHNQFFGWTGDEYKWSTK